MSKNRIRFWVIVVVICWHITVAIIGSWLIPSDQLPQSYIHCVESDCDCGR